jgi:hypothetical protein
MSESEGQRLGKGSAAELLANWRATERDHAAAVETASTATIAAAAAERAARAARETAEAARLSLDAAQRAEHAAKETAEAAEILSTTAARDSATANAAVEDTQAAEDHARDEFQAAQRKGFPKSGG